MAFQRNKKRGIFYLENTKLLGKEGENLAVDFLNSQGCEVIERNYNVRAGEIDIIFFDKAMDNNFGIDKYLVFAEVKYRSNVFHGNPYEAVTKTKIRKIIKTSKFFMFRNHFSEDTPVRYDIISIEGEKINWIKNAFDINF